MITQLRPKRSHEWRITAVVVVLLVVCLSCSETQDDSQGSLSSNIEVVSADAQADDSPADDSPVSSDNAEVLPDDTQLQYYEDGDALVDGTRVSDGDVDVSVDDWKTSPSDLQVDFDYIDWMFDNPTTQLSPPGDPQVDFDYIEWVLEDPAAGFVGLFTPIPGPVALTDDLMFGFLWIEYPCVYLRLPEPVPLDIQSVADLDLDLDKVASDLDSWLTESPDELYSLLSVSDSPLSLFDSPFVYESEPAHRILLQFLRGPSTRYDLATGQLRLARPGWLGGWWPPMVSGDFVGLGTWVEDLSSEYRSAGCDARGQTKTGFLDPEELLVSENYSHWR